MKKRFVASLVAISTLTAVFVAVTAVLVANAGGTWWIPTVSGVVLLGIINGLGSSLFQNINISINNTKNLTEKVARGDNLSRLDLAASDDTFDEINANLEQISAEITSFKEADKVAQKQISELLSDIGIINDAVDKIVAGEARINVGGIGMNQRRANLQTLENLIKHLQLVQNDMNAIFLSAKSGNLDNYVAVDKYKGKWKEIAANANEANNIVSAVVTDVNNALAKLAKGDLSAKMTVGNIGDYQKLRNQFNSTTAALSKYVNETHNSLGNLRANSQPMGDFPQDFGKIRDAIVAASERLDNDGDGGRKGSAVPTKIMPKTMPIVEKVADKPKTSGAASFNRMSGAYKPKVSSQTGTHDFLKNDFGKY
ncbi:MAG: hypothetical protein FWE33_01985 [Defluviitaleaceae bacterium]|nr:hypothetical protein [Defluviitaleaceae bacterium]